MQPDPLEIVGAAPIVDIRTDADALATGNWLTLGWLAEQVAAHHGATYGQAYAALHALPATLAPLVASAEGCTVLGFAAGGLLGSTNAAPLTLAKH